MILAEEASLVEGRDLVEVIDLDMPLESFGADLDLDSMSVASSSGSHLEFKYDSDVLCSLGDFRDPWADEPPFRDLVNC